MRALVRNDPEGDLDDGVHPSVGAWLDYKQFGRFPFAGGVRDQSPALMRDFRFIESVFAREQQRHARR